jgi:hypothetical protein
MWKDKMLAVRQLFEALQEAAKHFKCSLVLLHRQTLICQHGLEDT